MNRLFATITLGVSLVWTAAAGPLQKAQVAADARWVIHLDVEGLLATKVGGMLARESLGQALESSSAPLKQQCGFDFDWRRIRSVTLYGADFKGAAQPGGVLLVDTDMDVAGGLEAALAKVAVAGHGAGCPLERVTDSTVPLYRLLGEVYVAPAPGKPVVVAKARDATLKARQVLSGEAPHLNTGVDNAAGFSEFCQSGSGFFFLAAAQGFSELAPIPPQAQVLRMAEGVRLNVGEFGDEVRATVALSTRTIESAQQVQQIVQGLLALALLTQNNQPELQTLLQASRVSRAEKLVTLHLALPPAIISKKLVEGQFGKRGQD
jgi:hypothetical protein